MTQKEPYTIIAELNKLCFRTHLYEADSESMLHKGIYNYEMASILSATMIATTVYVILALYFKVTAIHFIASTLMFIIAFVSLRKFIFRERDLEIVFDKTRKVATLCTPRLVGMRTEKISFDNILSIEAGSRHILPANIDGIEFVQKISAQHGSPMPGLGEEKNFVTLLLKLTDGTERTIYTGKIDNKNEPSLPLNEIRDFLKK